MSSSFVFMSWVFLFVYVQREDAENTTIRETSPHEATPETSGPSDSHGSPMDVGIE